MIPEIMGKAHATFHRNDPQILVMVLRKQGGPSGRSDLEQRAASEFPWACDGIDWLRAYRPSEPASLAICHGDFHPLNKNVQDSDHRNPNHNA
jgi:hypothetical protein